MKYTGTISLPTILMVIGLWVGVYATLGMVNENNARGIAVAFATAALIVSFYIILLERYYVRLWRR